MNRLPLLCALVLVSCTNTNSTLGPPLTQFYFPGALVHVDVPGKTEGVLFVANVNLDKRYATGSIDAVALDALGLPPIGAELDGGVLAITDLKLAENQSVQIATFAGEMASLPVSDGHRLYVATRSEGNRVFQVAATIGADGAPALSCIGGEGQNCLSSGASLTPREFELSSTGVPRAPAPYGVAVAQRACTSAADCCPAENPACARSCSANLCVDAAGEPFADVFFTHQTQADSPLLSGNNLRSYLVRLDSDTFAVDADSFIDIGPGGANSVIANGNWAYVSGRFQTPAPNLMRLVNRDRVALSTALETVFRVSDSRALALSSDRQKLYMVGRIPDTLLVSRVTDADSTPTLSFVRGVSLCDGPTSVAVVPRAGRGDLAVVTCTSAGSVAIYDEEVGDLVALVPNVGVQPYAVAVDVQGIAARLYVSTFGDGRVAVIDLADVNRPQAARLVAHLGAQQLCLTRGASSPGCLASQGVTP
jgi:DNA-binding beta-propeller fold protein YncE